MAPSPPRPVQDEVRQLVLCPYKAGEQPAHLRHCHRNQIFICFLAAYPSILHAIATTLRPFVYRINRYGVLKPIELLTSCSGP